MRRLVNGYLLLLSLTFYLFMHTAQFWIEEKSCLLICQNPTVNAQRRVGQAPVVISQRAL